MKNKLWNHLAVKTLSALLRGMTSKHLGDFYCLKYIHFFITENKRKSDEKVCENKDFCNVIMPSEDTKILESHQYQKSDKAPFATYANLEYLTEKKIDEFKNNQNLLTTKVGKHTPSSFSMFLNSSFKSIGNKYGVSNSKDCVKKFCKSLKEQAIKITNFKKKKMKLLTKEQQRSYENVKFCYVWKRKFDKI